MSSPTSVTANVYGGATTVSIPSSTSAPSSSVLPSVVENERVLDGATRHTAGQEGQESLRHERAAIPFGQRGTIELQPGNPASATSIEAAIRMGDARRLPDGSVVLVDRSAEQQAGQQDQQAEEFSPSDVVLDEAGTAILNAALEGVPLSQDGLDATFASAIGDLSRGGDMAATARSLAARTGVGEAEAGEIISRAAPAIQVRFDSIAQSAGIDGDGVQEMYALLQERAPDQLARALQHALLGNDVRSFRLLVSRYVAASVPNEGDLAELGVSTRRDARGELLAEFEGRWVSATDLVLPPDRIRSF